jgi:H+/Cl- antiporter ClcA
MNVSLCADIVRVTFVSCVESGFFVAQMVMGMSLGGVFAVVWTRLLFTDEGSFGSSF